jgi:hypothetical protein
MAVAMLEVWGVARPPPPRPEDSQPYHSHDSLNGVCHSPAIASAIAGPQNACILSNNICVKLFCHTRFQRGTVLPYSSIFTLSSVISWVIGGFIGSLPLVRRASSLPPAWVLGGAASNWDILKKAEHQRDYQEARQEVDAAKADVTS